MSLARIRNYIQRIAKISSGVIENLPSKEDNVIAKAVKIITLVDTAQEFISGKRDPVKEYLSQFNVERKVNEPFVRLFFSGLVKDNFDIRLTAISNDVTLLKVIVPNNGELYFTEQRFDNATPESGNEFYHSIDFDFSSFMAQIWELFNGRIYVSISTKDYSWKPQFSSFVVPNDPLYGSANKLLDKMKERDLNYRQDGISRSYMFCGPPGTGKSTFALRLGENSRKIIKFDSKSMDSISKDNVTFLLDGLMPDYVIIDDIDKIVWSSAVATMLYIMESIKIEFPNTTIITTANEPQRLDKALLRPGRIDEIIEFKSQDDEDRQQILVGYTKSFNVNLTKKQIDEIISCTSGLSAAYLKEVAVQLKYSSLEEVLNSIKFMKTILGMDEGSVDPVDPVEPKFKKNKKRKKK